MKSQNQNILFISGSMINSTGNNVQFSGQSLFRKLHGKGRQPMHNHQVVLYNCAQDADGKKQKQPQCLGTENFSNKATLLSEALCV